MGTLLLDEQECPPPAAAPPGHSAQVDVLVSEPMGTLLVNERMIESYLWARDKLLKPGGGWRWRRLCNPA